MDAGRRIGSWTVGAALTAVLLTGCSTPGAPMAPSPPPPASPSGPGPITPSEWPGSKPPPASVPPLPSGTPAELSPARWQAILDDLARRGVTGTPEVVSVEAVTWPDSSLGCPSPGVAYTQALVDGMRVVVSVDGQQYDYRFGSGDQPKLCTRRR